MSRQIGHSARQREYGTDRQPEAWPASPKCVTSQSPTRYCDQPLDWRTRLSGVSGIALILLCIGCATLVTRHDLAPSRPPPAPVLFRLESLKAPAEPPKEVPDGARKVEQRQQAPTEKTQVEIPPMLLPRQAQPVEPARKSSESAQAKEAVLETSAPKSLPAPPAPQASTDRKASWEDILLAHLEKHRRYPAAARASGRQGVAQVLFRMNRAGQLLSLRVLNSSGSSILDRAALDTVRRAQPLPSIPDDRPDRMEIAVPIEFFIDNVGMRSD